jgi:hypothetical protein
MDGTKIAIVSFWKSAKNVPTFVDCVVDGTKIGWKAKLAIAEL